MQAAARRAGRVLSAVENRRWDDDFRAALAAVRSGELGRLLAAKLIVWSYGFPQGGRPHGKTGWREDPQQGGGALSEYGAHYFDQLLLLAPGEPHTIFAQLRAHGSDSGSEDAFSAFLSFSGGMTAQIEVDLGSIAPLRTGWTLTGTRGGYADFRRYSQTEQGEIFDVPCSPVSTEWDRFYDTLAAHLRENRPLPVTTEQAARVVGLIEGARESAGSGQVIPLPQQAVG
jgi:scyllo-inositol 2-dehydrogenase (NADP+)